jgi:fructose-1,6-bisphosphatase II
MTTTAPSLIPGGRDGTTTGAATLALPLLHATQGAAVACLPWIGRDDPKAADGAAVAALRGRLDRLPGRCRVVIGEGEKDDAPMLYRGEVLGTGAGPACDVAVDPLEGTRLCARGQDGAVSVIAAAPPGTLFATPGWYMEKLVVRPAATRAVSLDRPVADNLAALAEALGKPVGALVVGVQDRPRHQELVAKIRQAGAAVALFGDGDVMASLRVLLPGGDLDALTGIGGAPEGVITACAARLLGGDMQGRLAPQNPEERTVLEEDGASFGPGGLGTILGLGDLVADDDCVFVATAVTGGSLLSGPRPGPTGVQTSSFVSTPDHPCLFVNGQAPLGEH